MTTSAVKHSPPAGRSGGRGDGPGSIALWLSVAYAFSALLVVIGAQHLLALDLADLVPQAAAGALLDIGFVALTTLFVYLVLRLGLAKLERGERSAGERADADATRARDAVVAGAWKPFALVFAALFVAFAAVELFVNVRQQSVALEAGKRRVDAMARVKSEQVRRWLEERERSLHAVVTHDGFARQIERALAAGEGVARPRDQILQRLETLIDVHDYRGAVIYDSAGRQRESVGASGDLAGCGNATVAQALHSPNAAFAVLRVDPVSGEPQLDIVVAVPPASGQGQPPVAAICVRLDPRRYLFPVVEARFAGTRTGESYLIRADGDQVTYLTGVRGNDRPPMAMTASAARPALVAARAARTVAAGVIAGRDYRDRDVLAAVSPVAGTSWFVISKIDRAELLQRQRELAIFTAALVATFVVVAGVAAVLVARRQSMRMLRAVRGRRAERSLRERHFGMIARYANDIILLMDDKGAIIDANERAVSAYRYTLDELRALNASDLRDDQHADVFDRNWASVDRENGAVFEARQKRKDGSSFPVELSVRLMEVEGVVYRQAVIRDLTERHQFDERLRFLARHDELTGLPNRNAFNEALDGALARARRTGGEVAVLFVDLDDFKTVNDTGGHPAGDAVLRGFSERLASTLRATDLVARLGGDEFCVLVESTPEHDDAVQVAAKVLASVVEPYEFAGRAFKVGASIGICRFPKDATQPGELIRCADAAMYDAKVAGKNQYRVYGAS